MDILHLAAPCRNVPVTFTLDVMLKTRAEIAEELAQLASELAQPMPSGAVNDGWCPEIWQKWGAIFETLHARVLAGESEFSGAIARAMDFDGVVGGPLLDRAAVIGNALSRLTPQST